MSLTNKVIEVALALVVIIILFSIAQPILSKMIDLSFLANLPQATGDFLPSAMSFSFPSDFDMSFGFAIVIMISLILIMGGIVMLFRSKQPFWLLVILLGTVIPFLGITKITTAGQNAGELILEASVDKCLVDGDCPKPVVTSEKPPEAITARNSGSVTAWSSKMSIRLLVPVGKCLHWSTANKDIDDVVVERTFRSNQSVESIRWMSKIGYPVGVDYELTRRDHENGCPSF